LPREEENDMRHACFTYSDPYTIVNLSIDNLGISRDTILKQGDLLVTNDHIIEVFFMRYDVNNTFFVYFKRNGRASPTIYLCDATYTKCLRKATEEEVLAYNIKENL
jgi:hypothetical protein